MSVSEKQRKTRTILVFFFSIVFVFAGCQNAPATPPADVLWVDTTQDLGEISPYVFGGNHGPWAEFNPFSLEKTVELGITFMRWPGGNFVSGYHWLDGGGPRYERPRKSELAWLRGLGLPFLAVTSAGEVVDA